LGGRSVLLKKKKMGLPRGRLPCLFPVGKKVGLNDSGRGENSKLAKESENSGWGKNPWEGLGGILSLNLKELKRKVATIHGKWVAFEGDGAGGSGKWGRGKARWFD